MASLKPFLKTNLPSSRPSSSRSNMSDMQANAHDQLLSPIVDEMHKDTEGVLPGTTYPSYAKSSGVTEPNPSGQYAPKSFPGPEIGGRQTTVTRYEPAQLAASSIVDPLVNLINKAFSQSHSSQNVLPASLDRLQTPEEYLEQIGDDPGTFTYTFTWTDAEGEPIAAASAHRYVAPVVEVDVRYQDLGEGKKGTTFQRKRLPTEAEGTDEQSPKQTEVWELKVMAVDVSLQRHGVASYLMKLVDQEVRRRSMAAGLDDPTSSSSDASSKPEGRKVHVVLTTIKELNEEFYARRGYGKDYETWHEKGFLGSETGFHVVHMSKVLEI